MQRRLKKPIVYGLYGLAFILMLGGLFYIDSVDTDVKLESINEDYEYVSKNILENVTDIPVVAEEIKINKPFNNPDIKIVKDYYSINDDEETQKNAIIFYEDTYIPSSGVSYGLEEQFEVLSILDGRVKEIKEDDILGNSITIEHDNGIISIYQSITDITVKEGDEVKQGNVIAKSGNSNICSDLGNHLYFELVIDGVNVDPEDYYDKLVKEV